MSRSKILCLVCTSLASLVTPPTPALAQEGEPLVVERTRVYALESKETGAAYRILVAVPPWSPELW